MTTFLDFIRQVAQAKKVTKHYGPGPHKGTGTSQKIHAGAKQRKGTPKVAGKKKERKEHPAAAVFREKLEPINTEGLYGTKPTRANMQEAAKISLIADRSPSKLKGVSITWLLAARGVTEDLKAQYKGVKGKQEQRAKLDNRRKVLDAELKRRGVSNPMGAVRQTWRDWKPGRKIRFS